MNRLAIKFIKFYQRRITNLTGKCRFQPTCSSYALECYMKFNFFKATFLTLKRILRCNPLFKGGLNPTPLSYDEKYLRSLFEPKKND